MGGPLPVLEELKFPCSLCRGGGVSIAAVDDL
jgi:hypothetical protein